MSATPSKPSSGATPSRVGSSNSSSQLPMVSQRNVAGTPLSGSQSASTLSSTSPIRFLGRMSWERGMLDNTVHASSRSCKLHEAPSSPCSMTPSPSKRAEPSTVSQATRTPSSYSLQSASVGSRQPTGGGWSPMTMEESMDEVENLLAEHMRHYQPPSPARRRPSDSLPGIPSDQKQRTFVFAPLTDARILSDMAAQEAAEARTSTSTISVDADNERESTSLAIQHKYFGAAASGPYYRTYREMHGKPQLFVEKREPKDGNRVHTTLRRGSPVSDLHKSPVCKLVLPSLDQVKASPSGAAGLHPASGVPNSPRAVFLGAYLAANQAPPSLVLRKERHARAFDFSHQGLGDTFIGRFAACLPELPLVEAINVAGNRLSDSGVSCLLRALENKPHLTALDVSANPLGVKASRALRGYVRSPLCTLRTLTLNDAGLSDRECVRLAKALERNKSIEGLELRSNSLGQLAHSSGHHDLDDDETEDDGDKPAKPLTGGQALGAMLSANLTLQQLDLAWNLLRAAGTAPIAAALPLNYQLRELDLSHNALGDFGALSVAQALRAGARLRRLTLSYNGVGERGAVGLSSGLATNGSLLMLVLDGNPLGVSGGKALMHASCVPRPNSGTAVCQLSLLECSLNTTAPTTSSITGDEEIHVFNPSEPAGSYALDLSDTYEHMVAHELLRLAALQPARYHFTRLEYLPSSATRSPPVKLELQKRHIIHSATSPPTSGGTNNVSADAAKPSGNPVAVLFRQLDVDGSGAVELSELVRALRSSGLAVSDEQLSRLLQEHDYDRSGALQEREFADLFARVGFALVDADGSGTLDAEELRRVLQLLGVHDGTDADAALVRMLARYDLDGTGEIDAHEFFEFMNTEALPGEAGADGDDSNTDLMRLQPCEASSRALWEVPSIGQLNVDLVHVTGALDTDSDEISDQDQQRALMSSEPSGSENDARRESTISLMSDAMLARLLANAGNTSRDVTEQTEFLHAVLIDSALFLSATQGEQLLARQGIIGSASATTGAVRRLAALTRLLPRIADRREAASLVTRVLDLKAQWRERLVLHRRLGVPLHNVLLGSITNAYAFDLARDDHRAALRRLALLAQEEKQFSRRRSGRADTSQNGNWENFRMAKLDGVPTLLSSTSILNTLLATSTSKDGASSASAPVHLTFYYVSTSRPPRGTRCLSQRRFEQLLAVLAQPPDEDDLAPLCGGVQNEIEQDINGSAHSTTLASNVDGEQSQARARWIMIRRYVLQEAAERRRKRRRGSMSGNTQAKFTQLTHSIASIQQKLVLLELLVADRWLSCQQAQELVEAFPNAIKARARAACLTFARVVDLENFIQIYDALSLEDQEECVKRLGWLNILDPVQPDRQYPPLDLGVHDERELVQLLAQLALQEDVSCWQEASFRSSAPGTAAVDSAVDSVTLGSVGEEGQLVVLPPASWGKPDAVGADALKHHGIVQLRFCSIGNSHSSTKAEQTETTHQEDTHNGHRDAERRALRERVLCGSRLFL